VGSFGDAAIFSFGAGKIIDLGCGGAAVSKNRDLIKRVDTCITLMPEWTSRCEDVISDISALHTSLYNRFYPAKISQHAGTFIDAVFKGKDAYMFRPPDDFMNRANDNLKTLDRNLFSRREKATLFKEIFEHAGLHFHWPSDGGVFWRFNLFIENNRDDLLHALLAEGFKVSSWYPRVDLFMNMEPSRDSFTVADRIGSEILNLWVNMEVDGLYIEQISNRIIKHLKNSD
jgi:dTDP-4-amino-4,6-dideoxygalactose transaminase